MLSSAATRLPPQTPRAHTMRNKHTFNGNAAYMLQKYRISHMIIAFHYEEASLSSGEYVYERTREEGKPTTLQGQSFPWSLCHDLSDDLWKMAGWDSGDNKIVYLVVMGGAPTLISFYDSTCRLVTFSDCWKELPGNVREGKGRIKMQAAYDVWREEREAEARMRRRVERARTFNHTGPKPGEQQCGVCQTQTYNRHMGDPMCHDCTDTRIAEEKDAKYAEEARVREHQRNTHEWSVPFGVQH